MKDLLQGDGLARRDTGSCQGKLVALRKIDLALFDLYGSPASGGYG